ncbi:MAG: GNAT family N-acetyltransferase [Rhodospirillales bacterium]|nr:GNAT family N-acetyltransferase [Rhodospirillales bacterium]
MILETATIRQARAGDARGIARVEVETWRDAYPTLVPRAYLVGRLDERLGAERWRRRIAGGEAIIVAAAAGAGNGIVGYATWGPARLARACLARAVPSSQLYELYVAPWARERGIGRRLVREAAARMLAAGTAAMVVEVLEGNPSRWFYEAQGGRLAARSHHGFAGKRLPTVVYAWDDLKALVGAAAE